MERVEVDEWEGRKKEVGNRGARRGVGRVGKGR